MTAETRHDPEDREELIQSYLDDELPPERRMEVERLLESDPRARRTANALRFVKRAVQRGADDVPVPEDTRRTVRERLEREMRRRRARKLVWIAPLAAAILLAVFLNWPWRRDDGPLPSLVASDFAKFVDNQLPLTIETENAAELERRFDESLPHLTRVFDLSAMSFELLGGRVHTLGGRPAALFVYRDGSGQVYLCEMTPGSLHDLPENEVHEKLENDGISFVVYQREPNLTLVYWQEGSTICVLTSTAPRDQVVALAFAKAVKGRQRANGEDLDGHA